MSKSSKLSYVDASWNLVTGCEPLSAGCKFCFAKRDWEFLAANPKSIYHGRTFSQVMLHPERLELPLRWTKPRTIFVATTSDLFLEQVDVDFVAKTYAIMSLASQHTFMLLTKRADRMRAIVAAADFPDRVRAQREALGLRYLGKKNQNHIDLPDFIWPLPNIWTGVTVENQEAANLRLDDLLATPSCGYWVSAEPLIEKIDLTPWLPALHWVIAGGESGDAVGIRATHPDIVYRLKEDCRHYGVKFWFKQWGAWVPGYVDISGRIELENGEVLDSANDAPEGSVRWYASGRGTSGGRIIVAVRLGDERTGNMFGGERYEQRAFLPSLTPPPIVLRTKKEYA